MIKNKIKIKKKYTILLTKNYLKFYFHNQKNKLKKKSFSCFNTKRTKGLYRFFNLSRQSIKELSSSEFLPGLIKSSW